MFHYMCEVYRSQTFDYGRSGSNLFIRLKLSYTSHQKVNVYQSMVFDLPVPGDQMMVTRKKNIPALFISPQASSILGLIIAETAIVWHGFQALYAYTT